MRVTQTISIGQLRINSMSNSSILQVGTSGAIKARSEELTEVIPQQQADQKIEGKVTQELKPMMEPEGLPVEPAGQTGQAGQTPQAGQPGGETKAETPAGQQGTQAGTQGAPPPPETVETTKGKAPPADPTGAANAKEPLGTDPAPGGTVGGGAAKTTPSELLKDVKEVLPRLAEIEQRKKYL